MNWEEARQEIKANVKIGTDVNSKRSRFRFVEAVDLSGLRVRIGRSNVLSIPWEMLETCFAPLNTAEGYSGVFFQQRYPSEYKDHDCHVHVVGRVFVKAGFAEAVDEHTYKTR